MENHKRRKFRFPKPKSNLLEVYKERLDFGFSNILFFFLSNSSFRTWEEKEKMKNMKHTLVFLRIVLEMKIKKKKNDEFFFCATWILFHDDSKKLIFTRGSKGILIDYV